MANWVSQRSCFLGIELAATRSTSFCGLAKSCDSYQWHEMSDRKINILLSSKVTRALKMSWLRGLAPAVIYLDMKSARMNTIGLTVSRTQEISGTFFFFFPRWWIAAFPDFRSPYVSECKRNRTQSSEENFSMLEFDFNQVWRFVTEPVSECTGIPPTWTHLKQAPFNSWFVLIFPSEWDRDLHWSNTCWTSMAASQLCGFRLLM